MIEFLFFLLRKIWYLWGLFLSGIRYFDSCWTNYNTKAPVWRYADTSWQHQHPLHICIAAKMSNSFTFPLRSFLFISFLFWKEIPEFCYCLTTFYLSWKTLFSPSNTVKMPRLWVFLLQYLWESPEEQEPWYNGTVVTPISTSYSQESKYSLRYSYF